MLLEKLLDLILRRIFWRVINKVITGIIFIPAFVVWTIQVVHYRRKTVVEYKVAGPLSQYPVTCFECIGFITRHRKQTGQPWEMPLISEVQKALGDNACNITSYIWALDASRSHVGFCPATGHVEGPEEWFDRLGTQGFGEIQKYHTCAILKTRVPKT